MISDIREIEIARLDADICILGGGAAAIAMARRLIDSGLRVLILESGGLELSANGQQLADGETSGIPYFPLNETSYRLFGGNTFRWGARTSPLKNVDFADRPWSQIPAWPLSRESLDPYYDEVFAMLGLISPFNYEGDVWSSLGKEAPEFNPEVFDPCGFQFGKLILLGEIYRDELAKASNIHICLNATVQRLEADHDGKHVTAVVVCDADGNHHQVSARRYVLACGGIENARLLLLSNDVNQNGLCNENDLVGRYFMEHPTVNAGKIVSRNWQALHDLFSPGLINGRLVEIGLGFSEEAQRSSQCLNAVGRSNIVVQQDSTQALREIIWNLRHRRMPHQIKWYRDNTWLRQRLGSVLRDPLGIVINIVRHAVGKPKRYNIESVYLEIRIEQEPNAESRVTLSEQTDRFGNPRAHLHWALTERDKKTMQSMASAFDTEMRRLELGELEMADWLRSDDLIWPEDMVGGHHHIGTTRMSRDPDAGIVDEHCKAHRVDNLYIAGSSVFPSAGFVNPTSTLLALSLRLADQLRTELA